MVDIFKALAEDSRLRILALLLEGEMCVCEIEACLDMTQSNVSRHLSSLKNSGILDSSRKAQWAYYKISSKFQAEHYNLWVYLAEKLKEIPSFEADREKCQNCKPTDLCTVADI